jgi:S-adenosylmethionine:tRNA ribosyltransferase-isomerase
MKTDQLDYSLPTELIAQEPAAVRDESRLLVLDRAEETLVDARFGDVATFLRAGDCLVLNDTKVLPARFFARRDSGASLEGLFLTESADGAWDVMLKGARKVRLGERLVVTDARHRDFCHAVLVEKAPDGVCKIRIEADGSAGTILEQIGLPPLPPYIHRGDNAAEADRDRRRYQTVYAKQPGAVAAPTAGLHFTEPLLDRLAANGVRRASVTLHVGTGTFKPVTVEDLADHKIHREWFRLDAANAEIINAARAAGGRIVAVGTTTTRVLETVATKSAVEPGEGMTDLFIMPPYRFKAVDAMITNFHLPRSTLLALVAAFAGLDNIRRAYQHAIAERYRFYSYGDAMLIL